MSQYHSRNGSWILGWIKEYIEKQSHTLLYAALTISESGWFCPNTAFISCRLTLVRFASSVENSVLRLRRSMKFQLLEIFCTLPLFALTMLTKVRFWSRTISLGELSRCWIGSEWLIDIEEMQHKFGEGAIWIYEVLRYIVLSTHLIDFLLTPS